MAENDYEKSVGIWTHTIDGITHRIIPEESDNIDFLKAKREAQKAEDESILYQKVSELYFRIVTRTEEFGQKESVLNDKEKQKLRVDLKRWISLNMSQIIQDMMVAYKWTTPEKLSKIMENAGASVKKKED